MEKNLDSWESFEEELRLLDKERLQSKSKSEYLYRGQEDYKKSLSTTLERSGFHDMTISEYHCLISRVQPQIETFTGMNWNILTCPDGIDKWLKQHASLMPHSFGWSSEFQETYKYMVFLRHYGFPSPMIDWTISPYIAAYFAFRRFSSEIEKVSIYVYLESKSECGLKFGSGDHDIWSFGPYVSADKRHFIQQSRYTACIKNDDGEWRYVPHERTFARDSQAQDVLWKFNIPYTERMKVLKILERYNINALSLFGSTESLMETMSFREIEFRDNIR